MGCSTVHFHIAFQCMCQEVLLTFDHFQGLFFFGHIVHEEICCCLLTALKFKLFSLIHQIYQSFLNTSKAQYIGIPDGEIIVLHVTS